MVQAQKENRQPSPAFEPGRKRRETKCSSPAERDHKTIIVTAMLLGFRRPTASLPFTFQVMSLIISIWRFPAPSLEWRITTFNLFA